MEGSEIEPRLNYLTDSSGVSVMTIPTEFDYYAALYVSAALQDALHDPGVRSIVLDLAHTSFLDSGGIQALISFHADAESVGKEYRIRNLERYPEKVLKITGVLSLLHIEDPNPQQ